MPEDAECIVCNVFPFLDLFVIFVTFLMSNSICFFLQYHLSIFVRKKRQKTDVAAIVRGMAPDFEFRDPGFHGKRMPVQCHLCSSYRGTISLIDLIDGFTTTPLKQHLSSQCHLRCVASKTTKSASQSDSGPSASQTSASSGPKEHVDLEHHEGDDDPVVVDGGEGVLVAVEQGRCMAWSQVHAPSTDKLSKFQETLCTYARLSLRPYAADTLSAEGSLHEYQLDLNTMNVTIRHRNCTGFANIPPASPERPVCKLCEGIGKDRYVLKTLVNFATKYAAASLLRIKLFFPDREPEEIKRLKSSDFYVAGTTKDLDAICQESIELLQRRVRSGFLCIPVRSQSKNMREFISCVVKPSLEINPHDWNSQVAMNSRNIAQRLQSRTLSSVEDVELKMACKIANGTLRNNAVLQGLLCSLIEFSERQSRGLSTMRHLNLSDVEMDLISEAGVTLSLAAGNKQLLKMFGLAFKGARTNLSKLHSMGLPDPFMANLSDEVLAQNALLIDSLCQRVKGAPRRHLALAFDKTYLLKSLDVVKNRLGKIWVGSAFEVFECKRADRQLGQSGYIPLREDPEDDSGQDGVVDGQKVHKADEVLEFLVWDPCSTIKGRPRYPLCTIPCRYECSGLEMLHMVGSVLESGGDYVASIAPGMHVFFTLFFNIFSNTS